MNNGDIIGMNGIFMGFQLQGDVFGWLFVYLIIYFTLMPPCGGCKIVLCFSYSGRVNELQFSLNLVQFLDVLLGENNPKISEEEVEKLYVQANHFALVRFILFSRRLNHNFDDSNNYLLLKDRSILKQCAACSMGVLAQ